MTARGRRARGGGAPLAAAVLLALAVILAGTTIVLALPTGRGRRSGRGGARGREGLALLLAALVVTRLRLMCDVGGMTEIARVGSSRLCGVGLEQGFAY